MPAWMPSRYTNTLAGFSPSCETALSSAPPTIRRTLMTKPHSSSTVSTATTWRERSAVPDTSGTGRRFHLCEFTPSYDCPFVGSAIGSTDLDETDPERLDTDVR